MEFNKTASKRLAPPKSIAIDGPAASGKSTIAEKLAHYLGYLYLDTGVMYRAVTYKALQENVPIDNEKAVGQLAAEAQIDVQPPSKSDGRKYDVLLDGVDVTWEIRSAQVNGSVSQVSTYSGVRYAMTEQQRRIGKRGKVVMAGRDVGTVVLPEADLKLFLVASVDERAKRRFTEEVKRGENISYSEVLKSLQKRDKIDSSREIAPLKPAHDAHIINTDSLSIEQVFERILALGSLKSISSL